jgi:protein-tyrosine phosphatase
MDGVRRLARALRSALLAPYLALFYPLLVARRAAAAVRPGHAWRTWVTPHLLLGGFLAPGDVRELSDLGIRAVVNVTLELYEPTGALRDAGIAYLEVPCWDMSTPAVEDAREAVGFIAERIERGERVYVHCASGVGRSVAITLCYLSTRGGRELDAAHAELRRLRPRISLRPGQRRFVEAYVEDHRARGGGLSGGDGGASSR